MSVELDFDIQLWHLIVGSIFGWILMFFVTSWIQSKIFPDANRNNDWWYGGNLPLWPLTLVIFIVIGVNRLVTIILDKK